jgi:hypothetical protein
VNAFPLQPSPGPLARRWLVGGAVIAVTVVLCIWLLVAAGLQRGDLDGGPLPAPLPDVPTVVRADVSVGAAEVAPAPGAAVVPMEGSFSPR